MDDPRITFFRMHPDVVSPRMGTKHSIGVDLHAYIKSENGKPLTLIMPPNTTRMVRTGIVAIVTAPHAIFVCSRSGMATRGLFVTNAPGVIDPDYRGEMKVLLHNGTSNNEWIKDGDRIAQMVALPCTVPVVEETTYDIRTMPTERGEAGFGSTGA